MFHEIDFACDLSAVAWKTYQSGNIETAKNLYRRALRIFQRSRKKAAPKVAVVLNRLGLILENNREYTEAAQMLSSAPVTSLESAAKETKKSFV